MATFHDLSRPTTMSNEVATLKRELEVLKLQLEQERKKNVTSQGGCNDNPPQPERGSPQRDESAKPRRGDKSAAVLKKPRIYVQHAAVGVRRGKWWLRDRRVLSRATQDEGSSMTLKVRETWVWSGRTVILDKIVRLDEEEEQVEQGKPELGEEPKGSGMQQTSPVEVAAAPSEAISPPTQPTKAVETSEAVSTAGHDAVDAKVEEVASAKADDEVRESSAPDASAKEAFNRLHFASR